MTEHRRMRAEWEPQEGILMAWPHPGSDWGYIIDEARDQFARLCAALASHGDRVLLIAENVPDTLSYLAGWFVRKGFSSADLANVHIVECAHNDTWTRDYGPIGVDCAGFGARMADFGFNAWGLKFPADKDNMVTRRLVDAGVLDGSVRINNLDFVLEGGSVESDGANTVMTTAECLLGPNRNPGMSRIEIEEILRDRLGADRILWLEHGHIEGDDTDSHIDTLARFAAPEVIYYCGPENEHDAEMILMREQLRDFRTEEGLPYSLMELPMPDPVFDNEGNRLAATYANFLITPHAVYVPAYGPPRKDDMARMMLEMTFHDRPVVSVDCRTLIMQGGSLHCSTMQLIPESVNWNKL